MNWVDSLYEALRSRLLRGLHWYVRKWYRRRLESETVLNFVYSVSRVINSKNTNIRRIFLLHDWNVCDEKMMKRKNLQDGKLTGAFNNNFFSEEFNILLFIWQTCFLQRIFWKNASRFILFRQKFLGAMIFFSTKLPTGVSDNKIPFLLFSALFCLRLSRRALRLYAKWNFQGRRSFYALAFLLVFPIL